MSAAGGRVAARRRTRGGTEAAAAAPHPAAAPSVRAAARTHVAPHAAAPARPADLRDGVRIIAWLSLAAGAIHAIAMVDHFSHWWAYGVFFLVLTYGQVLWGVALLRRPADDRSLLRGAYASLAIVAVWACSRTIGVPIGPEAGGTEPVGPADVAASLDQVVLAAYVLVIVRPDLRLGRGLRVLVGRHRIRLGMMLSSATVFVALLGGHHH